MIDILKSEQYIAQNSAQTIEFLADFLVTDTIIFWSDDKKLACRQKEKWQPLLDILAQKYNLKMHKTWSLLPSDNGENQKIFIKLLSAMSLKELTGCFLAAKESKSPLLGLLLATKQIKATEVFAAAFLEELYQNEFWGKDAAVYNKQQQVLQTFIAIEEYLAA